MFRADAAACRQNTVQSSGIWPARDLIAPSIFDKLELGISSALWVVNVNGIGAPCYTVGKGPALQDILPPDHILSQDIPALPDTQR